MNRETVLHETYGVPQL